MKTKEEIINNHLDDIDVFYQDSFESGFRYGVEFAERWISVEEELPEEGKWVIAKHSRGTWFDNSDQENVNVVIVKLRWGISEEQRERMPECERKRIYTSSDVFGNNTKPYAWETFGPGSFFGQEITHWRPINHK